MLQQNYFDQIKQSDLTDLEAYQIYCSIKLHFNSKEYDYTKYGQNKKTFTQNSLNDRDDNYYFQRASEEFMYKERFIPLVVSNMYEDSSVWIKDLLDSDSKNRGLKFRAYQNNPKEYFLNDIKNLVLNGDIFIEKDLYSQNSRKNFFGLLSKGKIQPLTASILCEIYYTKYFANTSLTFVYSDKANRLKKLYKFLPQDKINGLNEEFVKDTIKDLD